MWTFGSGINIEKMCRCEEYVTSIVFRDDIIARFSPEALAGLHKQLLDLDLAAALQKVSPFAALKSKDIHPHLSPRMFCSLYPPTIQYNACISQPANCNSYPPPP